MGFRLDSKHWVKCSVSAFSLLGPGILGITVVVSKQPFHRAVYARAELILLDDVFSTLGGETREQGMKTPHAQYERLIPSLSLHVLVQPRRIA